jgi:hypothetical protein
MRNLAALAGGMVLMLAAGAQADPANYAWTGMGNGTGKCDTYRMEINVTVDGSAVKGVLKQQGRPERAFQATADANGQFKTNAPVGNDGTLEVSGSLKEGMSQVILDGYCKFGGKLTKQ